MQSPVWLKYCERHKVADADRDFAAEAMAGIDQRRREASAAMVEAVAAECANNRQVVDAAGLMLLAERMRNTDG